MDDKRGPVSVSVRNLAVQIGLPLESLRIITVNGKQETLDRVLADDDLIYFPPPPPSGGDDRARFMIFSFPVT